MRFLNAPEGLESDQVKVQDSFEEKLKAYNVVFFFFPLIFSPKYRQSLYNKNVLLVSPSKFISFSSYTRNGTFTLTSN